MNAHLEKNIKHIVSKIIHVPANKIDNNADLSRDLGADSLKAIEIIVSVEKKYKIKVPLKKLAKMRSITDIIEAIENARKR